MSVCGITRPLGRLSPVSRQVPHVLRTRSPVALASPRDLHVLSTPPAFVLSQDQTLQESDIARSSNRCHHAVAPDSVSESLNCSVKLSLASRTDARSTSSPRTSRFPKSIIKKRLSLSATAFNCSTHPPRGQAIRTANFAADSPVRAPSTTPGTHKKPPQSRRTRAPSSLGRKRTITTTIVRRNLS